MIKLNGFKVGWISRIRFSASSKMDINFPHGTQKIEILKKLDLHLKSHKKIASKG